MPTFEVTIGRSLRQYARIIVEATNSAKAESYVQDILDKPNSDVYVRLFRELTNWEDGELADDGHEAVVDSQDALDYQEPSFTAESTGK